MNFSTEEQQQHLAENFFLFEKQIRQFPFVIFDVHKSSFHRILRPVVGWQKRRQCEIKQILKV